MMLVAFALASTPVRAQSTDYRELTREASREFEAERWAEARVLLEQLYEIRPSGEALRLLGAASYELGDYVVAIDYFERALAETQRPLSDELRVRATAGLTATERFVGTVVFEVRPTGAHVRIHVEGSDEVHQDGTAVRLGVGPHRVVARAVGYGTTESVVTVRGAERQPFTIHLEPLEAPVPQESPTQPDELEAQQASQEYQLQPPGVPDEAPRRPKPQLGLPVVMLSAGVAMIVGASILLPVSEGIWSTNYSMLRSSWALFGMGGLTLLVGSAFLCVRLVQRRRWRREQARSTRLQYGFAPIIAPEFSFYGMQGVMSF